MPAAVENTSQASALPLAVTAKSNKYWETFLQDVKPCRFPALGSDDDDGDDDDDDNDRRQFREATALIDGDVTGTAIREFCAQNQVALGAVFQTAWAVVVSQYAGVEDVSFGYAADGEDVVVCRAQVGPHRPLAQVMTDLTRHLDYVVTHQNDGDANSVADTRQPPEPLFDSVVQVQQQPSQAQSEEGFAEFDVLARILLPRDNSDSYSYSENGNTNAPVMVSVRTRPSQFSAAQTANVAHTLAKVVNEIFLHHTADPPPVATTVGDLDVLSRHDREQVKRWNKVDERLAPVDACFHDLFAEAARRAPDAPAVCSWDGDFTYAELDALSSRLADRLVPLLLDDKDSDLRVVLICFDKSAVAYVSMLAIFKAGAAFAAVDPSHPPDRVRAIVEATGADVVLAGPAHCHLFADQIKHVVPLDAELLASPPLGVVVQVANNPPQVTTPSSPAYVVFTSGSTGSPKGIVVQHRALCTAATSLAAPMRVTPDTRFLQFAAYTFDLSYGDIFVTLAAGGCICVPSEHERVNDLEGAIRRTRADTACLIPSVARLLRPDRVPALRTLLLGGEALLRETLQLWGGGNKRVSISQMYGPSEATVWCASRPDMGVDSVVANIGRGVAARLWIASPTDHHRLVPVGCVGELLIEGPVLARGYLDAEQTRRAFVEVDHHRTGSKTRMYKTGDLARYDPRDGTVVFVGRKDTQVKLHGRRIEMGEIEYHLASQHTLLRQSMVTVPAAGVYAGRLVAVVVLLQVQNQQSSVARGGDEIKAVAGDREAKAATTRTVARLKDLLVARLPPYMVPQFWVAVEDIPLMISGKMNRVLAKKFVESIHSIATLGGEEEEHRLEEAGEEMDKQLDDPLEIRLRRVWTRVLHRDAADIGPEQTFQSLGGDSFSAMELIAGCRAEGLPHSLAVQAVLDDGCTIRKMAAMVVASSPKKTAAHAVRGALRFAPTWWD
ncbi:hypothetical protein C8A00DRAFT_42276 [Chaetomidium leptoderma]|uniref:Carrier domain-containing protein n=1 Tax=Chaetomidium leptoderma TaxID=669021 RepID=A0AAN6VNU5_9PEZI|nr:hypothetical protein C8A00DRAFT_42276 [Chaetomidium leptoderma]